MRSVSVGLGLVLLVAWSSVALAVDGTVRLKNGGFIQGDVLEVLPGEHVSVRTSDGNVRNIPWDEVDRVDEPQAPAPAPAPAPEQAAPPPPPPAYAPVYEDHEPLPMADDGADPAEERFRAITVTMFGLLGVLGEVTADGDVNASDGSEGEISEESDLAVSYGGGVQLDVPFHRHFSLAGSVRMTSWTGEDGERRALFVDFLAAPRLRFPFVMSPGAAGVFFVQVPIGAAYVDLPSDDDATVSPAFAIGVGTGFMALLSEHLGFSFEMGWMHHAFDVEVTGTVTTATGPVSVEANTDLTMDQPFFQAGLVAAF